MYHYPASLTWKHLGRCSKEEPEGNEPDFAKQRAAIERAGLKLPEHKRLEPGELDRRPLAEREDEVREELAWRLHQESSLFERSSIRPAIWRGACGRLSPEETEAFEARFLASDELVLKERNESHNPAKDLFTTRSCEQREARIVETVERKATTHVAGPSQAVIERAISDASRRIRQATNGAAGLDREQEAAIRHMCVSVGWSGLVGWAGTGKSAVGRATVEAFKSSGNISKVVVVSTAGATAVRSAQSIGGDIGKTVEGLEKAVEAAMMDTPRADKLVRLCEWATVRTIGDPLQLQAIGAGGWFEAVDRKLGHAELTNVHRQRDPLDRQICAAVRLGNAERAIESLKDRNRFHVEVSQADAVGRLVEDYEGFRSAGLAPQDILVLTDQSNELIDQMNGLVQQRRQLRGELGRPGVTVAETTSSRKETFHVGDRVSWVKNTKHGKDRVLNGTSGTVRHVNAGTRTIKVELDAGKRVTVSLDEFADTQPLRLGYASHANKAQGAEAKIGLILPGAGTTDGHSGYSMVTRPQEQIHVYASHEQHGLDPARTIAKRWSDFSAKTMAVEHEELAEEHLVPETVSKGWSLDTGKSKG